jgi:polyhydroxyalkanoate synthesis regulator phasin
VRFIDEYIDEYIDRNMENIIQEWQLASRRDISPFTQRVRTLEKNIGPAKDAMSTISQRVETLETRLKKIKEEL